MIDSVVVDAIIWRESTYVLEHACTSFITSQVLKGETINTLLYSVVLSLQLKLSKNDHDNSVSTIKEIADKSRTGVARQSDGEGAGGK